MKKLWMQLVFAACATTPALAGEETIRTVVEPGDELSLTRDATVLTEVGGELRAVGPDFKAAFDAKGMRFVPRLGPDAESHHLSLELVSIRRGSEAMALGDETRFEGIGARARTMHGPDVAERYDVRAEGLELSFAFDRLPDTPGDLVVRMALGTSMTFETASESGLAFTADGGARVHIGAVTGISADGREATGSLRLDAGMLELALPDDFVRDAQLPLVLDPLIYVDPPVWSGTDVAAPDIAYDSGSDTWLAVFERVWSATDRDVYALRLDDEAQAVGSLIVLEGNITPYTTAPCVAAAPLSNGFLVAWQEAPNSVSPFSIRGCAVNGITGATSITVELATGFTGEELEPDLGSERTIVDDEVLMVWRQVGTGILAMPIHVPANVSFTPLPIAPATVLSSVAIAQRPAISQSGGDTGRYIVAWEEDWTSDRDIKAALIDRNAAILWPETLIEGEIPGDEAHPACAGDGTRFRIVHEYAPTLGAERDIRGRDMSFVNGVLEIDPIVSTWSFTPGEDDFNPQIDFNGETFVRAHDSVWADPYVEWINVAGCSYEAFSHLGYDQALPMISSRYSGGGTGDTSLVLYEAQPPGEPTDLLALVHTSYGESESMGGGCGVGAPAPAACAATGMTSRFRVQAEPSSPAYLILSFESLDIGCGSCTLVADPFSGFLFSETTDALGSAEVFLPIPSGSVLSGLEFYAQWALPAGAASGCPDLSVDLSEARKLTIEEWL